MSEVLNDIMNMEVRKSEEWCRGWKVECFAVVGDGFVDRKIEIRILGTEITRKSHENQTSFWIWSVRAVAVASKQNIPQRVLPPPSHSQHPDATFIQRSGDLNTRHQDPINPFPSARQAPNRTASFPSLLHSFKFEVAKMQLLPGLVSNKRTNHLSTSPRPIL